MVVRVNRRLAREWRAASSHHWRWLARSRWPGSGSAGSSLAAAVGDHLVDVHVELSAAARHPHMQWEHVVMLAGEYLVTDLNDQLVGLVIKPLAGMVRVGGGFLQNGVRGNHLTRD
jgi:hypothetical protein